MTSCIICAARNGGGAEQAAASTLVVVMIKGIENVTDSLCGTHQLSLESLAKLVAKAGSGKGAEA